MVWPTKSPALFILRTMKSFYKHKEYFYNKKKCKSQRILTGSKLSGPGSFAFQFQHLGIKSHYSSQINNNPY